MRHKVSKYDVNRGSALYNSLVAPIVEYAGILTGVAGIVDDVDMKKIGIGLVLYIGAKGIASVNQYRIDSKRQETLEKSLKE